MYQNRIYRIIETYKFSTGEIEMVERIIKRQNCGTGELEQDEKGMI